MSLKKLANNDCSLRVVCGLLDLPVFSTDSVGNACGIDSSSVTISSVSETAEDCSCSNNLELSSNCLGTSAQPTAIGQYEPICSNLDGSLVYMHVNPTSNMYIYHVNESSVCSN